MAFDKKKYITNKIYYLIYLYLPFKPHILLNSIHKFIILKHLPILLYFKVSFKDVLLSSLKDNFFTVDDFEALI